PVSEMSNEGFDLLARGLAQGLSRAEVRRIGLHQDGIELMLADDLAEAVADLRAAIVSIGRLRWELPCLPLRLRRISSGSELLHRAQADPVCLAQGTVHGARLGHAHFGAANERKRRWWDRRHRIQRSP